MYLQHYSCKGVHHNHSLCQNWQECAFSVAGAWYCPPLPLPRPTATFHRLFCSYHAKLANLASAAEAHTLKKQNKQTCGFIYHVTVWRPSSYVFTVARQPVSLVPRRCWSDRIMYAAWAKRYRHRVECKFVFPYFVLQSLCAGNLCYILNEEIFFGAQCDFVSWASCKNAHVIILFYHCFVILRRYVFKLHVGAHSCSTKTWMYFPSANWSLFSLNYFF